MSSDTQRVSIVYLTPRRPDAKSLKYSPKPKTIASVLVQSSDTIEQLLLQQQAVGKRYLTKDNTLAFYFKMDADGVHAVCPAASGKVFKHGKDMDRETVASVNAAVGTPVSKIVFVADTWEKDVRAEMEKHFKMNDPKFQNGWFSISNSLLKYEEENHRSRAALTFDIKCELMLESIVNSIVTEQHIRAHSPGTKEITFEDLFLIKLYTFAQWVQCVRYCGVTLEAAASHAPPDQAPPGARKLAEVMKTPCTECRLQSDRDSWFVRFNGDTRGPGKLADRWNNETKKVLASLDKVNRKSSSFFRGMSVTIENIVFTVVDAQDAGEGDGLKAHSGGCKAIVNGSPYKNVHFDGNWVAYAVKGDPEVPPGDIVDGQGKLFGEFQGDSFVVNPKFSDRVFVVNKQNLKTCNRFHSVKPGDLVLNGYSSVMSVSTDHKKANEYAGGLTNKGTIWEIVTGNTGGKEIDPLSVIPPSHSDKETLIEPGTEMRVLEVQRCPHVSFEACKAHQDACESSKQGWGHHCKHTWRDFIKVEMLININNASQIDLMRLPQIGPARSFRIIQARRQGGSFLNRGDFGTRVHGFGTSTYWLPLAQFVTFGPKPKEGDKEHVGETESERYDRIMTNRKNCEMIARIPAGPGHPWGPKWTPYNKGDAVGVHPWDTDTKKWNGNLHGRRNAPPKGYEGCFRTYPELECYDPALFGKPTMTNDENYGVPGYTTPAPPEPAGYQPSVNFASDAMDMSDQEQYEAIDFDCLDAVYVQKVEPGSVTPVKSHGGTAVASPATPTTLLKAAPVKGQDRRPALEVLLKEMGIGLERLQNAALGKSASKDGLNMEDIARVLQHFNTDTTGCKRAELDSKLLLLLRSLGV